MNRLAQRETVRKSAKLVLDMYKGLYIDRNTFDKLIRHLMSNEIETGINEKMKASKMQVKFIFDDLLED